MAGCYALSVAKVRVRFPVKPELFQVPFSTSYIVHSTVKIMFTFIFSEYDSFHSIQKHFGQDCKLLFLLFLPDEKSLIGIPFPL